MWVTVLRSSLRRRRLTYPSRRVDFDTLMNLKRRHASTNVLRDHGREGEGTESGSAIILATLEQDGLLLVTQIGTVLQRAHSAIGALARDLHIANIIRLLDSRRIERASRLRVTRGVSAH